MVIGFTTTCAISANHHYSCELEPRSWGGVLDTPLCYKVCHWLATGWWFSPDTPVSFTSKTDRQQYNWSWFLHNKRSLSDACSIKVFRSPVWLLLHKLSLPHYRYIRKMWRGDRLLLTQGQVVTYKNFEESACFTFHCWLVYGEWRHFQKKFSKLL
jgi:hypothetical protein